MTQRPLLTPELIAALHRAVSRRAASVWVFLWASADKETGLSWPASSTIARAVRTNRNHVCEDVRVLEAAGWLAIENRMGRSSHYVVTVPASLGCNQDGTPPSPVVTGTGQGVYPAQDTHLYPAQDTPCIPDGTQNPTMNPTIMNPTKNKRAARARLAFVEPTLDEVKAYCQERGNSIDPQHFIDYHISNGWKVGRYAMRDWQATIRNWEGNGYQSGGTHKPQSVARRVDGRVYK